MPKKKARSAGGGRRAEHKQANPSVAAAGLDNQVFARVRERLAAMPEAAPPDPKFDKPHQYEFQVGFQLAREIQGALVELGISPADTDPGEFVETAIEWLAYHEEFDREAVLIRFMKVWKQILVPAGHDPLTFAVARMRRDPWRVEVNPDLYPTENLRDIAREVATIFAHLQLWHHQTPDGGNPFASVRRLADALGHRWQTIVEIIDSLRREGALVVTSPAAVGRACEYAVIVNPEERRPTNGQHKRSRRYQEIHEISGGSRRSATQPVKSSFTRNGRLRDTQGISGGPSRTSRPAQPAESSLRKTATAEEDRESAGESAKAEVIRKLRTAFEEAYEEFRLAKVRDRLSACAGAITRTLGCSSEETYNQIREALKETAGELGLAAVAEVLIPLIAELFISRSQTMENLPARLKEAVADAKSDTSERGNSG